MSANLRKEEDVNVLDPKIVWRGGIPGYLWEDGRYMPVISGGSGDDDAGGSGENDDDEGEGDGDEEEEESSPDEIKDPKAKIRAQSEIIARKDRRIKKMTGEIADINKKLKERDDKDKDDNTRLAERLTSAEERANNAERRASEAEGKLLVLTHEDLVDLPAARRSLILRAVRSDLEIDEEGDSNIDELLADLKEKDPDLFKTGKKASANGDGEGDEDDEEDEEEPPKGKRKVKSPRPPKGKPGKGLDRAELEKSFPILATRRSAG